MSDDPLSAGLADPGPQDGGSQQPEVETVHTSGGLADDAAWQRFLDQLRSRGPNWQRYSYRGELARGGMGVIQRVYDNDVRRPLAMKLMLGEDASCTTGATPDVDERSLGRFLEEAQVTGQLDHPGIVPVHELGVDADGQAYFTMKLVRGENLRSVFDRVQDPDDPDWNQTRALGVLLKVCEAMEYAHSKAVIHRDLKPANIMVGRYGEVYVMDWGIARVLGAEDPKDIRIRQPSDAPSTYVRSDRHKVAEGQPDSPLITMDGNVVGTPAYMSPEQARGELDQIGPQSDVYSVGAMLYHLLAGHMPYGAPGTLVNQYAIWSRVQEGPPVPVQQAAGPVPPELQAICEKAMARRIPERYATMRSLGDDIRAYLERRVVKAYQTGAVAEFRKWVLRNRGTAAGAAAAMLAVLLGLGATSYTQRQGRRTAERLRSVAEENAEKARLSEARAVEQARAARRATAQATFNSARLAAQRGRWQLALEYYDRAAEAGYENDVELAIGRIEAHLGRFDTGSAIAELDRISGREDLGKHRAKVLLLRGTVQANRLADPDAGQDDLIEAIELGTLGDADEAVAFAFLSPSLPMTQFQFERAVRADPSHHAALSYLGQIYLFLGFTDQARQLARTYRALYPENPGAFVLEGLTLSLEGKAAEAEKLLEACPESIPDTARSVFAEIFSVLSEARGLEAMLMEAILNPGTGEASFLTRLFEGGRAALRITGLLSQLPRPGDQASSANLLRHLPAPPAAYRFGKRALGLVRRMLLKGVDDVDALVLELDRLLVDWPIGWLHLMRGILLMNSGRRAEAIESFANAKVAPSCIPVGTLPQFLTLDALRREVSADWKRREDVPDELRAIVRREVGEILDRTDMDVARWRYVFDVAGLFRDHDLVEEVALRWHRGEPESIQGLEALSVSAANLGAYQRAIRIADEILEKDPENESARHWKARMERLRDGPGRP